MKKLAAITILLCTMVTTFVLDDFIDRGEALLPRRAGGYYIIKADFHIHTRLSDGLLSPFSVVDLAKRNRLHVIAVTEHNIVWPAQWARWYSQLVGGPLVIPGQEVTSKKYHFVALGIEKAIDWRLDLPSAKQQIQEQGGLAIIAHPTRRYWSRLDPLVSLFDAVEVIHPVMFAAKMPRGFSWHHMVEFYERHPHLTPIASTDYHHFAGYMGSIYTLVFAREFSQQGIITAIKQGNTLVRDKDGRTYGRAALQKLVNSEESKNPDRKKKKPGILTLVVTWAGLFALLILLLSGNRKPGP